MFCFHHFGVFTRCRFLNVPVRILFQNLPFSKSASKNVSFSCGRPGGEGGTSMFSVQGMCRWTGYIFHHSCSRAGYRFLQKCSQKGILFSIVCSQTGLQCIFSILCSQTGCGFLQFCSQTGVFKLRKMLPDRIKITAPQRHTPVHIRTKCPPPRGGRGPIRHIFHRFQNVPASCEHSLS